MSACWPLQMPPSPKAVLISLADNANDHGECWPSIAKICERTCLGKTAVIEAIKFLEATGLVLADRTNGRHSRYAIDLRALSQGALFGNEPVREANRSGKHTGPASAPNRSGRRTAPVRQADTNRKEPPIPATKNKVVVDTSCWPEQPNPKVLADWLAHRKAKRAPVSETVIEGVGRELAKAKSMGWGVDDCLTECMTRNWQGFKADWLKPDPTKEKKNETGSRMSAVERVRANCEAAERRDAEAAGCHADPYLVAADG